MHGIDFRIKWNYRNIYGIKESGNEFEISWNLKISWNLGITRRIKESLEGDSESRHLTLGLTQHEAHSRCNRNSKSHHSWHSSAWYKDEKFRQHVHTEIPTERSPSSPAVCCRSESCRSLKSKSRIRWSTDHKIHFKAARASLNKAGLTTPD